MFLVAVFLLVVVVFVIKSVNVVPQQHAWVVYIDNTDREEIARLDGLGFNKDF